MEMNKPVWATADGKKLKYNEITDDHLKNIIKDGYRSPHLQSEAEKRGFEYPSRKVDELLQDPVKYMMMIESIYSTALAGNETSERLIDLYESKKYAEFHLLLNQIL